MLDNNVAKHKYSNFDGVWLIRNIVTTSYSKYPVRLHYLS